MWCFRDLAWISAELTALNRHFGIPHDTAVQLPPDAERKFETCVLKIQRVRVIMCRNFGLCVVSNFFDIITGTNV